MNYLARRNGSVNWYYRESIPNDIRELVVRATGRRPTEVWKTLGTADPREARAKVAQVRADQHREWEELRNAAAPARTIPSVGDMADAVVDYVHKKFVEGQRAIVRAALQTGTDASSEAARRRAKLVQAELHPTENDVANMELVARVLCRDLGWDLAPGDGLQGERWNELVEMVTKAVQLGRGTIVDTLEGRPTGRDTGALVHHLGGGKRQPSAEPGETVLELFDLYKADCLRDGKSADTLDAEHKVIRHFASFVGSNRSIASIKRPDIRDFKRALSRVPHRWVTRKELKDLSLAEAANEWEKLGGTGRSQRTVARELSGISSFFAWLIDSAYVDDENPTVGFRPRRFDKKETKYPPYTEEQLKAVFSSALFQHCNTMKPHLVGQDQVRDWRYWLPLCALYSGARAGEIAQLQCADIRQEQGVWVFDFNLEGDDAKTLKTTSSRRIVPVHPALVRLGLLDHVTTVRRAGHSQLFPDITPGPRGDWSYRPSKFWQKFLKNIEVKAPGLCLHSFRHTFKDECVRSGVKKEVVQALLGHSDGSMTGHYGSIPWGSLLERNKAIESLSFDGLHDRPVMEDAA